MAGYKLALGAGEFYRDNTFTTLTGAPPEATASFDVIGFKQHAMAVTIATIDTNVIVELEGSHDGTLFFDLPLDSETPVTGLAVTTNRATITANGTYVLLVKDTPIKHIRLNFVSESGGTDATVTAVYHGSN